MDWQLVPRTPALPQDAWRGRQSAATTLAHMDSFFKTVLTSSMGNDLQVGGGWDQDAGSSHAAEA